MLWNNRHVVMVMNTELNGLVSGSGVLSTGTPYDNTIATGQGNRFADFWLQFPTGFTPAANSAVELYGVPANPSDDTTYEETTNGASPVVNKNGLLGVFDLQASSPQNRSFRGVPFQMYKWKFYLINTSGTNFPASNSIKLWIATYTEA